MAVSRTRTADRAACACASAAPAAAAAVVDAVVAGLFVDDLWSHVKGSADVGLGHFGLRGQLLVEAEFAYFDVVGALEENVGQIVVRNAALSRRRADVALCALRRFCAELGFCLHGCVWSARTSRRRRTVWPVFSLIDIDSLMQP